MLLSASTTNRWTSSVSLIVSTRTRLESLLSLCYPERSRLLTLTTLELIGDPEQRPVDHSPVIAGQIDDASFHDETAEFDEVPRPLAALDLPRAHVMSRLCDLIPAAGRSVALERRPRCGHLPEHFAAPAFERTPTPASPTPPSSRLLLSRPARSARPLVHRR